MYPRENGDGNDTYYIFVARQKVRQDFFKIVPTPNPSRNNQEGLKLLYSGDFVPTPLIITKL